MAERARFPDVARGQRQISARAFNELQDTVEAISRISFGGGLKGGFTPGGFTISGTGRGLFAKLTAVNNATPPAYSWAKWIEKGDGTFLVDPDNGNGGPGAWPAYDPNGSATLPLNAQVFKLLPSPAGGEYYLIQPIGSASGGGTDPVFGPSGPNHAPGDVPDPGAVAGFRRALFEDGRWRVAPVFNGARYGAVSYNVPNNSMSAIPFFAGAYDTGFPATYTGPLGGSFTIPQNGYYHIGAAIAFAPGGGVGSRYLQLAKKPAGGFFGSFAHTEGPGDSTRQVGLFVAADQLCLTGDTIQAQAFQNSGNPLLSTADEFYIHLLGAYPAL